MAYNRMWMYPPRFGEDRCDRCGGSLKGESGWESITEINVNPPDMPIMTTSELCSKCLIDFRRWVLETGKDSRIPW